MNFASDSPRLIRAIQDKRPLNLYAIISRNTLHLKWGYTTRYACGFEGHGVDVSLNIVRDYKDSTCPTCKKEVFNAD